jgi:DNA-directed RNA polymerase subunit beta'
MNYNMGLITNNERYNQVIDIWTSTNAGVNRARYEDESVKIIKDLIRYYMMLDSGARGSKEQIRQLTGMRGING